MTINSNKIKNNNIFDIQNNINKIIYIKLSNIKENEIVLDSKLPIHEIKGNNNWINKRNIILELSTLIAPIL